ncbi:hypothetical protein [Campylobacter troglodytis]|nr:hypothetical protein [Campylobacter troglodytis]
MRRGVWGRVVIARLRFAKSWQSIKFTRLGSAFSDKMIFVRSADASLSV